MDWDEALKLLKGGEKGIGEWNQRRGADEAIPDLSSANLSDAYLTDADLRGANLRSAGLVGAYLPGADLVGADLRYADLGGAILVGADLHGAILVGADLSEAHLGRTQLSEANLSGAYLRQANLSGANLRGTDFGECKCAGTIFADVNLSEGRGLDSIKHLGPSTVGIDTLFRSHGKIPEGFLRGCGVPDALIVQQRALVGAMEPIQFYSCFISYSSKDQPFAERLYSDLQGKGVRCWYAPEDLKIGEKIRVGIDESIRIHDKLLLVLSKNSVASDWVEKEVETAMEKERQQKRVVLFPIRLDDAVMKMETGWPADIRRSRNIGDFKKWKIHDAYQKTFDRLLRDLKAEESTKAKRV